MSKKDVSPVCSDDDRLLLLLQSKRDVMFARMQRIYDSALQAEGDSSKISALKIQASNIDSLRKEFEQNLDLFYITQIKLDPLMTISYQAWTSFEEMYCFVKQVLDANNKNNSVAENIKISNFPNMKSRLPPIELMEFDGNSKEWPRFYQQFKSLIHDNPNLSSNEKVFYLVSKLKNQAALICAGLPTTPENYNIIWNALIEKYDDPRMLASSYLNQLLNFKSLSSNNATGLESFLNNFNSAVEALKQLKLKDLSDFILLHLAIQRLDVDTVKLFEITYRQEKIPTYEKLIQFVKEQSKVLSRSNAKSFELKYSNKPHAKNTPPKLTKSFLTTENSSSANNDSKCVLCNNDKHDHLYKCPAFMKLTPRERFDIVKRQSWCTNCLSVLHKSSSCSSSHNCLKCFLRHHSLLCFSKASKANFSVVVNVPTAQNASSLRPANAHADSIAHSLTLHSNVESKYKCSAPHHYGNSLPANLTTLSPNVGDRESIVDSHAPHQYGNSLPANLTTPSPNVGDRESIVDSHATHHYDNSLPATLSNLPPEVRDRKSNVDSHATHHCGSSLPADRTTLPSKFRDVEFNNDSLAPQPASLCTISRDSHDHTAQTTLLGTAKIKINDKYNRTHFLRCLVDPGSQSDYISIACCKKLSLPVYTQSRFSEVQGIGGTSQRILGISEFKFKSRFDDVKEYSIRPLVVKQITSQLPDHRVDVSALRSLIKDIPLADDSFAEPGNIDLLIGVKLYCDILLFNKISGSDNSPTAIETTLGYVIMGDAPIFSQPPHTSAFCAFSREPLDQLLEKFWKVEEAPTQKYLSPEEQECEKIYVSTTTRNSDGSFAVDLPFKESPDNLGNSYISAKRRYLTLERKFDNSPDLRLKYNEVIQDYLDKGIISKVSPEECVSPGFFLPHRPVIRNDKETTKLRIVLDATMKTDNSVYLNDILHTGCNLQAEIFNILLNVRLFKIPFFADVRQMYLCIEVRPPHRKYQRILYRLSRDDPLDIYEFNRVIFGLRSTPFLALRTLREVAERERKRWPLAAEIVERDVYMDDLASSASSLDNATDNFSFINSLSPNAYTKRAILSATVRLYDVLGLVGPIILFAKLIMKELWLLKIGWDETPPSHIVETWHQFMSELTLLSEFKFPRHIGVETQSKLSLLAFADASEKAYGCVIYTHVTNANKELIVSLVCSKSRVSSPSKLVTLARLESNASAFVSRLLLAELVRNVYDTLVTRHTIDYILLFSHYTLALCWLSALPQRFQIYIANCISQFQTLLSTDYLYLIPGVDNPVDCISRGLLPSQLLNHDLWFKGPHWASLPIDQWPVQKFMPSGNPALPEQKTSALVTHTVEDNFLLTLSTKFSCWSKFLRSVVYILRFIKKLPKSDEYYETFSQELAKHRVSWKLNAPSNPHHGGLWESNIKSAKTLLGRVIGNQILTYEKMLTVITQVEAILNSRPLYVLSTDPSEPSALTPAHFLNKFPLEFLPAHNLSGEREQLLSRFMLLDSVVQSFWKRFKSEYLHTLQTREKWNTISNPVTVGTVVLINVDNAPPLQWPLGIITRVFPGRDGTCRVAEVKAKNSSFVRPIVKLCPLPLK